jgi:hypothetical protein
VDGVELAGWLALGQASQEDTRPEAVGSYLEHDPDVQLDGFVGSGALLVDAGGWHRRGSLL